MSVLHHTFTLERRYPAPVDKVFAAWQDPAVKRQWFAGDADHTLDFRVGGDERIRTTGPNGKHLALDSRYLDIVPERRIVYTSTLSADDELATVSTTSIELEADGTGTLLVLTESDVFLDGQEEPAWREQGTGDWLDKLGDQRW
jgi:uncharacterized protein YndB with AHSA1/START domain